MSTAELKEKIIAKVASTDDQELLEHISDLIEFEYSAEHEMSAEEIAAVNEGTEQMRNGQWISHEESNRRISEWLKKFDGQ